MLDQLMSVELCKKLEMSESLYMWDRMLAIQERKGNPEGVELARFGESFVYYSKTMPWPQFNTVKSCTEQDVKHLDDIIDFFQSRDRQVQFEITPGSASKELFQALAERGYRQSGFHSSLYSFLEQEGLTTDTDQQTFVQGSSRFQEHNRQVPTDTTHMAVRELVEHELETYAKIHCRGTGLPDSGIEPVSRNNQVLLQRPGWHFFIAEVDGIPCSVGVMHIYQGVASLTFAATLPEYRNRGLHTALIRERIKKAKEKNCSLVVGQTSYASQSYRNMEKAGLKLGYTRATWTQK